VPHLSLHRFRIGSGVRHPRRTGRAEAAPIQFPELQLHGSGREKSLANVIRIDCLALPEAIILLRSASNILVSSCRDSWSVRLVPGAGSRGGGSGQNPNAAKNSSCSLVATSKYFGGRANP
jgi:hypothetical protein